VKSRRRKIFLAFLALVLGGVGFAAWSLHYRPKWELAKYQRDLVAAGEKLTIAELIPVPVRSEENSAHLMMKALPLVNTSSLLSTNSPAGMRFMSFGKAMATSQQPDIRDFYEGKLTNTWAEVDLALTNISDGLELLRQITEHPTLDFGLQYSQGFMVPLGHLMHSKIAAQRLAAAALSDLHRGDTEAATKNVRAILAMVKGSSHERLVISQLVRYAIAAIAVTATWEMLQSSTVTDAQLAALQRDWEELDFITALENSLAMERAMGGDMVGRMRRSSTTLQQASTGLAALLGTGAAASGGSSNLMDQAEDLAKSSWDKTRWKFKELTWRVAWSYPDHLRMLKGEQALLDCARFARTNGYYAEAIHIRDARLSELGISNIDHGDSDEVDMRTVLSQSVLSLNSTIQRAMSIEVERKLCVTAIALKRYQLRHGNYPDDLAALVPEILTSVPRDPVDGKPLRYRRDGEKQFVLYSVGEDEKDDGGDPRPANEKSQMRAIRYGRDSVWPQPASAEEIEANYARLVRENARKDGKAGGAGGSGGKL
jgi:hypothetical protein